MTVPDIMRFSSPVRQDLWGMTLLDAQCKRFTYLDRSEWTARILAGQVLVNGETSNPFRTLVKGDVVETIVVDYTEPEVPTDYTILFENEEFLVAEKPAGTPVHKTGRIFFNTFTSILRRALHNDELVPMHRLDRDTSGAMLFAKSHDTALRYQKNLSRLLVKKIYLLVADGHVDFASRLLEYPLREDGSFAVRDAMVVDYDAGKECRTQVDVLGKGFLAQRPITLCQAELLTGRKHQIRAHMAACGFPVLGDCIYAHGGQYYCKRLHEPLNEQDYAVLGAPHQLLHAWKLQLHLPGEDLQWVESTGYDEAFSIAMQKCSQR